MTEPAANARRASREGIEGLVARLLDALRQHDAVACAALFTDDCLLLSPYGPAGRGRDAIKATHQAWFEEGETNKRLKLLDADANGEFGYCVLAYAGDYLQPDGSYATDSGQSVNVVRWQTNGDWKIHVQSLNNDKPPLAPEP